MTLSLPWAWVQSLVGELRSCKPCGVAKKKKKERKKRKKKYLRFMETAIPRAPS